MFFTTLLTLALALTDVPTLPPHSVARFDTVTARSHIEFLASDQMRGRDTPSPELELAADYIEKAFKRNSLEPVGASYSQVYELERLDLSSASLRLIRNRDTLRGELKSDMVPFEQTGEREIRNAPLIFAGYGITAHEYDYDDYAGLNIEGHVVLVLRGEPESPDTTKFKGKAFTRYASTSEKIKMARSRGAVGILVLDALRSPRKPFVTGYPWSSLFPRLNRASRPLVLPDSSESIPAFHVGESIALMVFDSLGAVVAETRRLDSTLVPASRVIPGVRINATVALSRERVRVRNIVGMLKGSSLPDEYVVIGAHYDHIGVGKADVNGDSIYNGADDNGSGTAGLLLAAEAMAASPSRPERSIVFVAFSGEEKGLLGSKAYVRSSPLPLEKCVAMINLDMIGRCLDGKLSIGGNTRCPDLSAMNEEINSTLEKPFILAYDIEPYFFRSDQASFAMKRIPVLFYFTGEHKDYHKQSDNIDKINMLDLINIARLSTELVWRAAHHPRTTYIPAGFEDR